MSLLYKQMSPSPHTKVQAVSQDTVIPGELNLTVCPCNSNNLWPNEGFAFSLSNYHIFIDMHWEAWFNLPTPVLYYTFSFFWDLQNICYYCKTSAKTVKSVISVWGCLLLETLPFSFNYFRRVGIDSLKKKLCGFHGLMPVESLK